MSYCFALVGRLMRLVLVLVLSWAWVGSALAAVSSTTINFGPTPSSGANVGILSGLNFSNNWYSDWDPGANFSNASGAYATTNAPPTTTLTYGTSATPAVITVATAGDRFNISTLMLTSPGTNTQVIISAYRNGVFVTSVPASFTPGTYTFYPQNLNFQNIDELRFVGDGDGWISIDNLVVAPYLPTITLSPAAGALATGAVSSAYNQTFSASGGTSYTYTVSAGSLPAGLTLSSAGVLSGTPTTAGTYSFSVTATDASTATATNAYTLTIAPTLTLSPAGPALPGAVPGIAYSQQFSTSGGTSYTYSLTGGSLPPGLSLSASGLLSGTPTTSGNYSFTVKVTDVSTATTSQAYTLAVVTPTITVTPSTIPAATVGAAYSQTFSASGGSAPYTFAISAGALPAGLSLNTSSGVISGTPTAGGTFSFTVTATDSNGSGPYSGSTGSINFTVNTPTISFSPSTLAGATVGSAYNQSINASGGTAPYRFFSVVSGNLPPGMALSTSGALSGTPTQGGTFTFAVQATDSSTGTGPYTGTSGSISITVAAPTITLSPASLPAVGYGVAYSQTISASGGTAPYTYSLTAGTLPTGLSLATNGVLSGTTTQTGSYAITLTATDSSATPYSQGIAYTLTVNPAMPVAGAVSSTVTYNTATPITLNLSGGAAASVAVASSATHGTATASGTSITYTPTSGYVGSDSFTYTATNATGTSAPATVTITVNPQMAVAGAVSTTVAYNSSANPIPLNISGGTPSSVAVASGASHGTATVSGTSITYTPTSGYVGSDSFTYTATNGGGTSAPATVSITVNPLAPVAGNVSATVVYNTATPITLNLSGGTANSVAVANGAAHGTAVASGTSITYTPTSGYVGSDSFTYTATNATATSAPATVTITVNPQMAVAGAVSATVAYNSSANPIALNITGGTPTSVAVATSAAHGTATVSGTSITYTPTSGYVGSDSFTYTATNGGGTSTPATVSITVNPALPVAGAVSASVAYNTATPITLNLSGGAAASVAVASSATHGTATASGTSITYTPTSGYVGSDSFTYTATNATGTSAPATVTVTVNPLVPVANGASATVSFNTATAIPLNITGGTPSSVAVGTAPAHGTATVSGTSITYTPTSGYVGSDSFTYTATNGGGTSAPATVSITVKPALPVAGVVGASVAYNTATPITLNLSGGAAASVAVASSATHGTATASGTSITYTPTSGYVGSDSFTYTATNATGTSAPATVTVTVNPLVPVANGVSATVSFNTATAIPLNITGGTPTSVAVGTAPAHGTATVSGTSITYTPTTGYSGSDSFTYKAINAGGTSAPATVSITVKPALPTAGAVTITVPINSTNNPIPLNLSGGAASSVAIAGAPSHGTVQISGLAVTYTPTAAYRGTDTFTYTATNATGTSAPAMVTIQVMSRPDPSKDQNVIGLVDSQMETAKRFAQTQIGNFQSRLENLHARLRPEGSDGMQAQGPQDPDGPQGLQRGRRSAPALVASSSSPGTTNMASTGGAGSIGGGGGMGGPQFGSASTEVMPQGASGGLNPFAAIGSALTSSMGWPSLNLGGKASNFNNTGFDVWSAGVVNIGRQDDPGVNFTTSGVSFGADRRFSDDLILGVGAGFGHDRTKLGDGGRNTANDYSVSVYGSYQPLPGTFIDAIVGVGRVDMASQRYATDAGTYATAQRSGDQWFASLSGAYEFRNDRYIISPYGRLDLASTRLDATKESGAGIYNLAYLSQRVPTTKLSFGLRGETMIALESAKVRPYFRAEYQHDFENPGVARLSYADDLSGPVYQISPTGVDRSALVFGAGSDFEFKNTWSLGVRYQYSNNFGSMIMHTLGVNVRKSF